MTDIVRCQFVLSSNGRCVCQNCGQSANPNISVACDKIVRQCQGPGLVRKTMNFAVASARFITAGMPLRTDEQIMAILTTHCETCEFYSHEKHICVHRRCGCRVTKSQNGWQNKLRWATESCPIGKWSAEPNLQQTIVRKPRWISSEQRVRDIRKLIGMIPANVSAVAGVPRSGMAPAMMIAESRHLWPFIIHPNTGLQSIPHGWRLKDSTPDCGALLIVDDTIGSGRAMNELDSVIPCARRVFKAAVYCNPEMRRLVDFCAVELPLPHYLEWSLFNSPYARNLAVDFDGVLCEECPTRDDDDGKRYLRFLRDAKPKYLIRSCIIPLIATARLEKYRDQTEAWLAKYQIQFEQLTMGRWTTKETRGGYREMAELKGIAFRDSRATVFVESCPMQSREIAIISGKSVICPTTGEVI